MSPAEAAVGLTDDPRVDEILDRAPVLHSAVDTGRGLHVTPTAFTWSGGALWTVTTRDSVKIRSLRRRRKIGLLLRSRRYDLVATGRAELVDPVRGSGIANVDRLIDLPFAGLGYFAHNSKHVAGVLRDADPGPGLLLDRLAIRVRPQRAVLLSSDPATGASEVLATWGDWTSGDFVGAGDDTPATPADPTLIPSRLRQLLRRSGPGAMAWPTVHGPIALPAHWPGLDGPIEANAELLTVVGAKDSGPAGMSVSTGGYRLATKRGVLVRGTGHAGPRGRIHLEPERLTWWEGDHAETAQR